MSLNPIVQADRFCGPNRSDYINISAFNHAEALCHVTLISQDGSFGGQLQDAWVWWKMLRLTGGSVTGSIAASGQLSKSSWISPLVQPLPRRHIKPRPRQLPRMLTFHVILKIFPYCIVIFHLVTLVATHVHKLVLIFEAPPITLCPRLLVQMVNSQFCFQN